MTVSTDSCGACGSPGPEFACSRCKVTKFCGPECFRKAWRNHKASCSPNELPTPDGTSSSSSSHPWPSPGSLLGAARRTIAFIDFWPGFQDNTDLWFCKEWFATNLCDVQVVEPSDNPDVIVFTLFGRSFLPYLRYGSTAKLVFFTGENVRAPVGKVPLSISFDHVPSVPTSLHTRIPLWVFNKEVRAVLQMHAARLRGDFDTAPARRSGFCCWVASNASMYHAQLRLHFVQSLSARYKEVDCGGEVMNNVGGPVKDKLQFLRGYRFNVCFENASFPGYCTEKLLHAFAAGCIPIYWGDPLAAQSPAPGPAAEAASAGACADFNPKAFISAHDFESPALLINHIERVDRDPALFESYLKQPILSELWYERLKDWPAFCRGLTDLLFADAAEGTPAPANPGALGEWGGGGVAVNPGGAGDEGTY